jgi:hypothetical protein
MLQPPARDAFQLLDWILSRHVEEYLDVAGRPIGEGRSAAIQQVPTELQSCPYAGSRHHHAKPMNVSALRQIIPLWEQIITMLSWLSQRYRTRNQKEITSYEDLLLIMSAGVFLADFVTLREHRRLGSREIPLLISGLYKVCFGFQHAVFLGFMEERIANKAMPEQLPTAAEFHDFLEAHELLIGEAQVCAGPQAMIMQAYDAMTGRRAVTQVALPSDCTRLEIAWEQHDVFTDHAGNLWNDLVMYLIETAEFFPELADPRLPADVQDRLNACLKQRASLLLAGQSGLVVNLARGARQLLDSPSAALPREPLGPQVPTPILEPASLAATVLTWLNGVAEADMQTHAPVVASALQGQLAPYDLHEGTVLAGLNQHLSCLMEALGLGRPSGALTPSALSHVCGRTLRDWGDPSW